MPLLETINTSIDIMKKLKEVNEKTKDAEIKMLIADLGIELAELKCSFADLLDENRELKDQIKELSSKKEETLIIKNGLYYRKNEDGPFCTGCYDSKKEVIRLTTWGVNSYKCPVCSAQLYTTLRRPIEVTR